MHKIIFQSYSYNPSSLNVNVGDTIEWQGQDANQTFELHPLASQQIPAGAAVFGVPANNLPNGSGPYMYVVKVAGQYEYRCNNHFAPPLNMVGSFTAIPAGVEQPMEMKMMMDPLYPNPAMDEAMVHFTLDKPEHVTLRIYNSTGTLVQTTTDETMGSGFHMLMIDTKQLASGSYQYVLQAGDAVLARAMIVAK